MTKRGLFQAGRKKEILAAESCVSFSAAHEKKKKTLAVKIVGIGSWVEYRTLK